MVLLFLMMAVMMCLSIFLSWKRQVLLFLFRVRKSVMKSVLTGEELWHQISEYGRNHDIFDTDQIKGSF